MYWMALLLETYCQVNLGTEGDEIYEEESQ